MKIKNLFKKRNKKQIHGVKIIGQYKNIFLIEYWEAK